MSDFAIIQTWNNLQRAASDAGLKVEMGIADFKLVPNTADHPFMTADVGLLHFTQIQSALCWVNGWNAGRQNRSIEQQLSEELK